MLLDEQELAGAEKGVGDGFDVAGAVKRAGNDAGFIHRRRASEDREIDGAEAFGIACGVPRAAIRVLKKLQNPAVALVIERPPKLHHAG